MNLVEYYKKILSEAYSARANRIEKSVGKQETQLFKKYGIENVSDIPKLTGSLTPEEREKYTGSVEALGVAQAGLDIRHHEIASRLRNENPNLFHVFTTRALKTLAPMIDHYRNHRDFEKIVAPIVQSEVGRIYSIHAQEVNNPNSPLNDPMNFEGRQVRSQFGPMLDLLKKKKK